MKTNLLLFFVAGLMPLAYAQIDKQKLVEFGLSPSMNYRFFSKAKNDMTWMKNQHDSLQQPSSGLGIFVNYEIKCKDKWSYFVGLAHNKLGYQYKDRAIEGHRSYILNFHYLQLPLGCNFYFIRNERIQFSLQPSLQPSFLLVNRAVFQTTDAYEKQKLDSYPTPFRLAMHAQLAGGISIRINPQWRFRAQLFYQQQLNALTKGDLPCRLYATGFQVAFSKRLK
jgi:hypothetical protein